MYEITTCMETKLFVFANGWKNLIGKQVYQRFINVNIPWICLFDLIFIILWDFISCFTRTTAKYKFYKPIFFYNSTYSHQPVATFNIIKTTKDKEIYLWNKLLGRMCFMFKIKKISEIVEVILRSVCISQAELRNYRPEKNVKVRFADLEVKFKSHKAARRPKAPGQDDKCFSCTIKDGWFKKS